MATKTNTKKRAPEKGKRYSAEERQEILHYVDKINNAKGRGGIAAAARRFSVSPLTVANWLKGPATPRNGKVPINDLEAMRELLAIEERRMALRHKLGMI